jgi:hypothetical protein
MAGLDSVFSNVAGASSDLFAAKGFGFKAKGARIEQGLYNDAAVFADQNVAYTERSTAIKTAQEQRKDLKLIGGQTADIASAGFAASGSALDILAESASQGAHARQVLGFQGQITEAGYEQQAKALRMQGDAAGVAAEAADEAAKGANISAAIHGVAAIFSLGSAIAGGIGGGGPEAAGVKGIG